MVFAIASVARRTIRADSSVLTVISNRSTWESGMPSIG